MAITLAEFKALSFEEKKRLSKGRDVTTGQDYLRLIPLTGDCDDDMSNSCMQSYEGSEYGLTTCGNVGLVVRNFTLATS